MKGNSPTLATDHTRITIFVPAYLLHLKQIGSLHVDISDRLDTSDRHHQGRVSSVPTRPSLVSLIPIHPGLPEHWLM